MLSNESPAAPCVVAGVRPRQSGTAGKRKSLTATENTALRGPSLRGTAALTEADASKRTSFV